MSDVLYEVGFFVFQGAWRLGHGVPLPLWPGVAAPQGTSPSHGCQLLPRGPGSCQGTREQGRCAQRDGTGERGLQSHCLQLPRSEFPAEKQFTRQSTPSHRPTY